MKYFFFLDETGDHGLSYVDKNFPLFLLCGCLIREDHLIILEEKINRLKMEFFGSKTVVLHSRDIRKCEKSFQIFFDLSIKERFYNALNAIVKDTPYQVIGSAVNKEQHIKKYGKGANDP